MKILIVEDGIIFRRLVKKYLLEAGYDVVETEDGQAAWDLIQREPFHFVITDWMMPGLSGPELVQKIRTSGQKYYTYIIMLTAMDDKENIVFGLESGVDDYLTKPFNNRELIARVANGMRILKLEEQLVQARQQMEVLAMYDGLTGLLNRRAIEEKAETEFSMANQKGLTLSVILLDIDHFKSVNDRFGHKFGDHTLRQVAKVLADVMRSYDYLGRWGGEEFILILPNTQIKDAAAIAERLRVRMEEKQLSLENGEMFSIQISLGVAGITSQFPTLTKLIDAADQALYQSKQAGRNRVCVFKPLP